MHVGAIRAWSGFPARDGVCTVGLYGLVMGFRHGMACVRWDYASLFGVSGMGWHVYVGAPREVVQRLSARYV